MTAKTVAVALAALLLADLSYGGETANEAPPLAYFVVESPVSSLLERIAKDSGKNIRIDGGIAPGFVRSQRLAGSIDTILDKITADLGLVHFSHNETVYISRREDLMTRIIAHPGQKPDDVQRTLAQAGLNLGRFAAKAIGDQRSFMVTAPPQFIALAETIIGTMPEPAGVQAKSQVVVRRGTEIVAK